MGRIGTSIQGRSPSLDAAKDLLLAMPFSLEA
jgi:hypothetical protein